MLDDWIFTHSCAVIVGWLFAWNIGRALLRQERARWFAPPDFSQAAPPANRLADALPEYTTAPETVVAALARQHDGEVFIALLPCTRPNSTANH